MDRTWKGLGSQIPLFRVTAQVWVFLLTDNYSMDTVSQDTRV
jgi:hypothetical protein